MGRTSLRARRYRLLAQERGAELVELAIILPFFLGLLFACFDLARLANGYAAVRSAAFKGARDASGLQRQGWNSAMTAIPWPTVGAHSVPIGSLTEGTMISPAFKDSHGYTPPGHSQIGGNINWYDCMWSSGGAHTTDCVVDPANQPLNDLYRIELLGIAYANQLMRQNTGSDKFPCDANATVANGNTDGEYSGCFRCFTLRGDPDYADSFSTGGGAKWLVKVLALRCQYDVPITSTSVALGWFPRHITLSSDVFIDVDALGDNFFFPNP